MKLLSSKLGLIYCVVRSEDCCKDEILLLFILVILDTVNVVFCSRLYFYMYII